MEHFLHNPLIKNSFLLLISIISHIIIGIYYNNMFGVGLHAILALIIVVIMKHHDPIPTLYESSQPS